VRSSLLAGFCYRKESRIFFLNELKGFNGFTNLILICKFSADFKVKKVITFVFAISVIGSPSLAWGWGEGGCSGMKDNAKQETKTEQVEETDA
tara:strand:- start:790 stop:1068 length:279 start_codon:yes stop_codon:yes gene_type:complete